MNRRTLSLAILPMVFAPIVGCAAPSEAAPTTAAPAGTPAGGAATPAAIIFGSCPQKPVWPEAARREKRQGSVVLAFEVEADNTVLDAKVMRSSGHADLDEAARAGLARCKFKAAMQDGHPVRGWAELTYKWTL